MRNGLRAASTVDGSEIGRENQLRLVVYPNYLQGFLSTVKLHYNWIVIPSSEVE